MKTPDYVQVVGFLDQSLINIKAGDTGGELDPHGADLRGNPLGGLVYSNAFGNDKNNFQQVIEWHNFMGGDSFCFKVCDPAGPNAARYCEHVFDRIGCAYNAPNAAKKGTFESCLGESQDFPGVYTQNGQVMTYTQPPESLGAIASMPYTARIPASSQCQPFESAKLYAALPTPTAKPTPAKPTTPASSGNGSGNTNGSGNGSGSSNSGSGSSGANASTPKSANASKPTSGASTLAVSGFAVISAIFSVALLS
jgi:hypothetical protein